jgi:hypothetical protein
LHKLLVNSILPGRFESLVALLLLILPGHWLEMRGRVGATDGIRGLPDVKAPLDGRCSAMPNGALEAAVFGPFFLPDIRSSFSWIQASRTWKPGMGGIAYWEGIECHRVALADWAQT